MNSIIGNIIEGIGLGKLKFGMEMNTVQLILGKPEEKEKYSYTKEGDDLTESWHYDELELSLGFDEEDDWLLGTIAVTSKDYKFRDFIPIGLSKEQLKLKLKENKVNDLEFEEWATEENPSHELLSSESLGINFWFDKDNLTEVQWGPLFIDYERIKWPE